MNISDQIIQVIDHLAQKFGVAINWSSENIMPIVEELCAKYISYEIMTSKVCIIIASIVLLLIIIVTALCVSDPWLIVVMTIVAIFPITYICCEIFDIIRCTTFPELQIFQYIQTFMN